jgi:hypothetical protein
MKHILLYIVILFLFVPNPSLYGSRLEITPDLSIKIIDQLRKKYIPMYQKYQGVESTRQVEIKTYDSKTNQLLHISQVHLIRKDYFYKEPDIVVLKYVVDGKEKKPSKYKPIKYRPGYQVFDKNGDKNYDTQVVGYKTINSQQCYEVNVTPKEATELHYKGKLYYRVSDLMLAQSSGSIGKISFPLKTLHMDFNTESLNDLIVVSSGIVTASVDIPVIMPNRRIVSRFSALKNKPIL